jgi:hypothetical protein
MSKRKEDFFVSYNKADETWAKWIAGTLEAGGYSTIINAWDFIPGENFVQFMSEAFENVDRVIAVLSPDYFESLYCMAELTAALARGAKEERQILLPVRVTNFEPKGLLASISYIDLSGKNEEEAGRVLLENVSAARAE